MTNQKKTDYICISKESERPAPDTLDETLPLIPPRYDWLGDDFYDGLRLAGYRGENPRVGYINLKGEEVIAPKRWSVTDFENGAALVSFDSQKWGAINTCGKLIVPCEYNQWELYREEDKVCVCINGVYTSFDLEGNVIKG